MTQNVNQKSDVKMPSENLSTGNSGGFFGVSPGESLTADLISLPPALSSTRSGICHHPYRIPGMARRPDSPDVGYHRPKLLVALQMVCHMTGQPWHGIAAKPNEKTQQVLLFGMNRAFSIQALEYMEKVLSFKDPTRVARVAPDFSLCCRMLSINQSCCVRNL